MSLHPQATDAIDFALKSEADYVDVRIENEFTNTLRTRNKVLCNSNANLQEGIGIRVLIKNCWGFASTSSLNNSSIKRVVENAIKCAKKISNINKKPKIILANVPSRKTNVIDSYKKDPQLVEMKERVDLLNLINARILSNRKFIKILDLKLNEDHIQKLFINSEGSEIEQILIRSSLFFGTSIGGYSNFKKVRTIGYGGIGGIEQFEQLPFDKFLENFISTLPNIAQAKLIKPREQMAILNEEMGSNLCHEFSHAVENDLILADQSPLGSRIGNKIGSEEVSIINDPNFKGYGQYYFDDEGVKASSTIIVENGILYDLLQSRETAGLTNAIPTSNGRAENCLHCPQVRQSNTFFEPGNLTFEELLEEVYNGLYICDTFGGNADIIQGNFQLDAQYGQKIEKGKLGDFVTGFSIIGNLYTILGDVINITKDFESYPSVCGKNGQRVKVGAISPKIGLKRVAIISNNAQQMKKIDLSGMR